MTGASRFTVGRAECVWLIPRDHPAPETLRRRAEEVARERLSAVCGRVLDDLAPEDDPSVWIIDRLDVDFAFDAHIDDDTALAEVWSAEIGRALIRAMRGGRGVVRFETRAAFVARFVADVARGRDAGPWYYAPFDSLRALPASTRIREAILREPAMALDVILELARTRNLATVVAAMSERTAAGVWDSVFPRGGECAPSPRLIEILLSLREAQQHPICLAAAALGEMPSATPAGIRLHVDALLALAMDEPFALAEAILDGDLTAAVRLTPNADIAALRLLVRLGSARPDLITCAAASSQPAPKLAGDLVPSDFAALALLLRPLADLQVVDDAGPELRAQIAALCAGNDLALHDPIMRLFRGGARVIPSEVEESPESGDPSTALGMTRAVLDALATRLLGFAGSSAEWLRENFLTGRGTIRFGDETIDVFLPPVPLALLLRMTGIHRSTVSVPWLPDQTITLFLPEAA